MTIRKFLLATVMCSLTLSTLQAQTSGSFSGYLFAYFEGRGENQEALRFAISDDAINWHALNSNKPINKP